MIHSKLLKSKRSIIKSEVLTSENYSTVLQNDLSTKSNEKPLRVSHFLLTDIRRGATKFQKGRVSIMHNVLIS